MQQYLALAATAVHNTTIHPASLADAAALAQVRIVGYVAVAMFGALALVLPAVLVGRKNWALLAAASSSRPGAATDIVVTLPQPLVRAILALALLTAGWCFVPFNAMLWDGGSVARVAFNALVWYVSLLEVGRFYGVQEPVATQTYAHYVFIFLAWMALCVLGAGVARLLALVAVAPLIALAVLAATLWGTNRDRLARWPRSAQQLKVGHAVLAVLAGAGIVAMVTEACSAEYGGAMPLVGGFVAMFAVHSGLCGLWLLMAFAPAPDHHVAPGDGDDADVDPLVDSLSAMSATDILAQPEPPPATTRSAMISDPPASAPAAQRAF